MHPLVTNNYFKEREGVLKVALELNKLGHIFRETPYGDVGIDGHLEQVNSKGEATGNIIAVQIKSGDTYLIDKGKHYAFYPLEKHKEYWSTFPLPILLFVNYPSKDIIYFTDVRYQLNIPQQNKKNNYIEISKLSILNHESSSQIFETTGNFSIPHHSINDIFNIMLNTICPNPTFNLSYLDLFTQGLTNICRHLYFSMDLAINIADYNNKTDFGLSIGYEEHAFLYNYVKFIYSQNLANINYSDYLIDWNERQMQPMFIAPLNNRGYLLLQYIQSVENIHKDQLPPTTLVRERLIEMLFFSPDDYSRLEMGLKLREILVKKE